MVRYLIRFGYIGTKYRGVQSQGEVWPETVARALELSLESLRPTPANVPKTSLCSRTDKGVHALMNAVHVDLDHRCPGETYPPHAITQGMNKYFRENNHEILAIRTTVVPGTFSVRRAAKWRSYIYRLAILKPEIVQYIRFGDTGGPFYEEYLPVSEIKRCHVVNNSLDVTQVKEVLKIFHGVHDFSFFTQGLSREPWRSPIRCINKFEFCPAPNIMTFRDPQYLNIDMWEFYIQSRSFLYYQVRKMIAIALQVGMGRFTKADVLFMLEHPEEAISKSIPCPILPPCGLFLSHIQFDEQQDFVSPREESFSDSELDDDSL